jgi:hypothetical protein
MIHTILQNEVIMFGFFSTVIFALTQALKIPFKKLTSKIANEKTRKRVNCVILIFPFLLGILADALFSYFYHGEMLDLITGLGYGTGSIALYNVVERFLGVSINNPYKTEEGKDITNLVEAVAKDGKVNDKDLPAVKEYIKKLNK